jgi:hypothetical protein
LVRETYLDWEKTRLFWNKSAKLKDNVPEMLAIKKIEVGTFARVTVLLPQFLFCFVLTNFERDFNQSIMRSTHSTEPPNEAF